MRTGRIVPCWKIARDYSRAPARISRGMNVSFAPRAFAVPSCFVLEGNMLLPLVVQVYFSLVVCHLLVHLRKAGKRNNRRRAGEGKLVETTIFPVKFPLNRISVEIVFHRVD